VWIRSIPKYFHHSAPALVLLRYREIRYVDKELPTATVPPLMPSYHHLFRIRIQGSKRHWIPDPQHC
jgi:hypothetical protein